MGEHCVKVSIVLCSECVFSICNLSRLQQVQIYYAGKSRYLGVFDSKLEAAVAYELARECCSTFERDPSPEEAAKNVILIRNAAFTVQTKGLDSEPGKKKKRKTK
jgi:hypothetical protein